MADRGSINLLDLPDNLLELISSFLDPNPWLFNLALTCHRWRELVNDPAASHHYVVVSASATPQHRHGGQQQNKHRTLEAALQACRPGSTIKIAAGTHDIPPKQGLIIGTSVNIIGDGADGTVLRSPEGCDAALDVRATCKIVGVAIESVRSSCVVHRAGHLSMECCRLSCDSKGLDHLVSPLLTMATTNTNRLLEGPGRLSIAECSLEGGAVAIQCLGTGSLASVRVIYRSRRNSYFFGVDCQVPGIQQQQPRRLGPAAPSKASSKPDPALLSASQRSEAAVKGGHQETAAGVAALSRFLRSAAERAAVSAHESTPGALSSAVVDAADREAVLGAGPLVASASPPVYMDNAVCMDNAPGSAPEPLLPSQGTWEEEQLPEVEAPAVVAETVQIGVQQRMRRESLLQDRYKF